MGGIAKILGVQTSSLTPETVAEVITDGVSSAFQTSSTSTTAGSPPTPLFSTLCVLYLA